MKAREGKILGANAVELLQFYETKVTDWALVTSSASDRNLPSFIGKRIDNGEWIEGYYFISPLTDENSGTPPESGWFFLSGERRHCISTENGVVYVVEPDSVQVVNK